MATGSQAAARERLQAARYRTGRAQFETRCDSCMHCTDAVDGKQHARRNSVHRHGPEVARLSQLKGAITRQINKRRRAQEQAE